MSCMIGPISSPCRCCACSWSPCTRSWYAASLSRIVFWRASLAAGLSVSSAFVYAAIIVFSESPIFWTCCWYDDISFWNCASASARPGACARIARESMYANLRVPCAWTATGATAKTASATTLARTNLIMVAPEMLEDLAELEVQLPGWCNLPLRVHAIEAVADVDPERGDRRDHRGAEPDAALEAHVDVARALPHVARVEEEVDVDLLVEAHPELGARRQERAPEVVDRVRAAAVAPVRQHAARSHRELGIAAELLSELDAAEDELLVLEERARVPEHRAGAQLRPEDELDRRRSRLASAQLPDRRVAEDFGRVALEGGVAA